MSENNSDVIEAYDYVCNDISYVVILAIKIFPLVTNVLSQHYHLDDCFRLRGKKSDCVTLVVL